ncbi:hypothetical protein [uncultured Brevundimonas sp.]|uniref:hypothetical protein n=1 Tax=uncultured Brevundimonas sp. TaxID=213418 RepID=UPI0025F18262|nr:hypothetical protein [uncultured Brevundimonas sp.]
MVTLALLAAITGFALSPAPQADKPNVMYMGPHPQPVSTWSASYKFDCGERQVILDIAVSAGRARVSRLDLGRGEAADILPELNRTLATQSFNDVVVTCTRIDPYPSVMIRTFRENTEGGYEPSAVLVNSVGPAAADVAVEDRGSTRGSDLRMNSN